MRDPKTEQFLTKGNWKYKLDEKLPLKLIDIKGSIENPSRLYAALDDDRVLSYWIAMENGDKFPAIVLLNEPPDSPFPWSIATGCHRISAAEMANMTTFPAYCVTEPDNYRREVLRRQLNTIEGHGVSIRDRILQILLLHEKYPSQSLNSLAKEWNLKPQNVHNAWVEQSAIRRARKYGYSLDSKTTRTPQKTLIALNSIHSDKVFEKAVQFLTFSGANSAEMEELSREIKKATPRNEESQLNVVSNYLKQATAKRLQQKAKTGRVSPTEATKFVGNCKTVMNAIDRGIDNLHLTALPRPDLSLLLIEGLITGLKKVIDEIRRIDRMRPETDAAE